MNAGMIVFLCLLDLVLGGVCYSASGPWGWSRKARILYGMSGMLFVGIFHFMFYTGVANPNSPSEDPVKVFKRRSEFYEKWSSMNRNQRFVYSLKAILVLAMFLGAMQLIRLIPPKNIGVMLSFTVAIAASGRVRDVLLTL
jgi:hypothetical protein